MRSLLYCRFDHHHHHHHHNHHLCSRGRFLCRATAVLSKTINCSHVLAVRLEPIDVIQSDFEGVSCLGKSVTKSVQDITVDLCGCVNDVQISSFQYASDHDDFHVTVVKSFVCLKVSLVCSSGSSVGMMACPTVLSKTLNRSNRFQ